MVVQRHSSCYIFSFFGIFLHCFVCCFGSYFNCDPVNQGHYCLCSQSEPRVWDIQCPARILEVYPVALKCETTWKNDCEKYTCWLIVIEKMSYANFNIFTYVCVTQCPYHIWIRRKPTCALFAIRIKVTLDGVWSKGSILTMTSHLALQVWRLVIVLLFPQL